MSYFNNNNFAGTNFGHPFGNEEYSDFEAPYHTLLDSDAAIAGPSRPQDWYPNPSPEVYTRRFGYQESTILDVSGNQFVDPCALHTEPAYGGFNTDSNVYGRITHEQARNIPGISAGGLAATPRDSFMPPTLYPLAAGSGPNYPTPSVDKGKARATDIPSLYLAATGNDTWRYQQPRTTENHGGSLPQTVLSVPPNTENPVQIARSSGPQRSTKGAKTTATAKGRGKGKHTVPLPVAADSSWEQTKDRFIWALLEEYFFRPAGRSINPEVAFANIHKHIKEDLHRSPIAAQAARDGNGKRASRIYEQYVTHILKELRRSSGGEVQNEMAMFAKILEELTNELAPVNTRRVLRENRSKNKNSSGVDEPGEPGGPEMLNEWDEREEVDELDEPEELDAKARHGRAEKRRRDVIRGLLHEISAFFLVTGNKVSAGDVILFIITYLKIGEVAFPGLVRPRFPGDGQL